MNTGPDQRVGTRRCAPLMSVRLEIDVKCAAACPVPSLFQREHLSMLHANERVDSGSNDISTRIDDHSPDVRTG
jgi:hypothetical protein